MGKQVFFVFFAYFAIRIVNKGTELSYIGNGDGEWLSLLLNGTNNKLQIYIVDGITVKLILKHVQGMYNFISSERF